MSDPVVIAGLIFFGVGIITLIVLDKIAKKAH